MLFLEIHDGADNSVRSSKHVDYDRAAVLQSHFFQFTGDLIQNVHERSDFSLKKFAVLGEDDVSSTGLYQFDAQLAFKSFDGLGQSRLRHVEFLRGIGNMEVFSHSVKVFELK